MLTKSCWYLLGLAYWFSTLPIQAFEEAGNVCPEPRNPCINSHPFNAHDLSFQLPKELKWQTVYRSKPFFAIILKSVKSMPDGGINSAKTCLGYITEEERLQVQALFPEHKVFASRNGCSDSAVTYTNVNTDYNFVAVYAAETQQEAEEFLSTMKTTEQFPGLNSRKMEVIFDNGD